MLRLALPQIVEDSVFEYFVSPGGETGFKLNPGVLLRNSHQGVLDDVLAVFIVSDLLVHEESESYDQALKKFLLGQLVALAGLVM